LVTLVGAVGIGLVGCDEDGSITEPPPPPPSSNAEISVVSFVDPETGNELGKAGDEITVSGLIGVVIDFDTGGLEAQSLDLILDDGAGAAEVVNCGAFSGGTAETVLCEIDTGEGAGVCQGQAMAARFANGTYAVAAQLTLQDGSTVSDEAAGTLTFDNGEEVGTLLDLGPRIVSVGSGFPNFGVLDGTPYWGGPRDLTWTACPVVFDPALADICSIEISAGTLAGTGDLDLGNGPGQRASSEAPFTYTAAYRDSEGAPVNEDLVEDDPSGGGTVIGDGPTGYKVFLCDGTDVTSAFEINSDVRHLDTTAPRCDPGSCEPEIDGTTVLQKGLYSGGDFSLGGLSDGGVGGVYGVTTIVDAYEFDSGDEDNQELFLANPAGIADLPEDDGCGFGQTTHDDVQFGCLGTEAGVPVDAYFLVVSEVEDLLGNAIEDATAEFSNSDEFGVDVTAPDITDIEPDNGLVWNMFANAGETFMFEADDPLLASEDDPSGVDDAGCDGADCTAIEVTATNDAATPVTTTLTCTEFAAGSPADMFECVVAALVDDVYTFDISVPDKAVLDPNVADTAVTVTIDTQAPGIDILPPIPGDITTSNASAGFALDGAVSDLSGLSDATVGIYTDASVDCSSVTALDEGTDPGEVNGDQEIDITADAADFSTLFVVVNTGVDDDSVDYCLIVDAEDNATDKDGDAAPNINSEFVRWTVTWNPTAAP
jgi:hypothetical protein